MSNVIENLEGEIWKDIIGFDHKYMISNKGRVKSLCRKEEILLKFKKHNRGYSIVSLCRKNKMFYFLVHRLVAIAFIPNVNQLDTVDHIDENKRNNNVENLRWMTNLDNWKRSNMGVNNPKAKLTEQVVRDIREYYKNNKVRHEDIAKIFGISRSHVSPIVNNKFWKNA